MGKRLQGAPLLQRSVLKFVEQEVTNLLVQPIVKISAPPRGVCPPQEMGEVLEPVRPGSALGAPEGDFEELGQAAHGLGFASDLRGEVDAGQLAGRPEDLVEVRPDGPTAEGLLAFEDLEADTLPESRFPVECTDGVGRTVPGR